jgi:hypothetical protein
MDVDDVEITTGKASVRHLSLLLFTPSLNNYPYIDPVGCIVRSLISLSAAESETQEQGEPVHRPPPSCNRCGQRGHIFIGCRQPNSVTLFRQHASGSSFRRGRGRGGSRGRRPYSGRPFPSEV